MDLQVDLLAGFLFIGWPVYQLLAISSEWTADDEHFYQYLASHSKLFPTGWWRILFPLMWTILWPLNGVGSYLFWHAYAAGDDTVYLVGSIFYMVFFIVSCAWMRIFFKMRALRFAFVVTFIFVWGGALGYCVCAYLYPQIFAAVAATVLVVWTTYATLLTFVAAYFVPPHKKHEEESRRHERSTVEEVADWDVGIDKRVVLAASMTPTASQPQKAFGVVGSSVQQRSSHVGLSGKELILPPPRNQ